MKSLIDMIVEAYDKKGGNDRVFTLITYQGDSSHVLMHSGFAGGLEMVQTGTVEALVREGLLRSRGMRGKDSEDFEITDKGLRVGRQTKL